MRKVWRIFPRGIRSSPPQFRLLGLGPTDHSDADSPESLYMGGKITDHPLTNEAMIADFSAVGGFIILATGLRICDILPAPLVSILPALILAMPMTDLWMRLVF